MPQEPIQPIVTAANGGDASEQKRDRTFRRIVAFSTAIGFAAALGSEARTVIAGYPLFTDWGRDTMISLPGLTLFTGNAEIAKSILRNFARHVDQGMLPNRFVDSGETAEFNTVDATLWFFEAARAYADDVRSRRFPGPAETYFSKRVNAPE